MSQITVNIRFLLWKEKIDRREWPTRVAGWANCLKSRAAEILRGEDPVQEELVRISANVGIPVKTLREKDLLEDSRVGILFENVYCLINGLDRGKKSLFADDLGLHPTTISAWLSGRARPDRPNLGAICRYFRLPAGIDLEKDPLFLSYLPVSEAARKKWIRERVAELDAASLQEIFPVMERILRG